MARAALAALAVAAAAVVGVGASGAVADAQGAATTTAVPVCAEQKVTLPTSVLERTGGVDVPVLVDVHTGDLSALPGASTSVAPTAGEAEAAVLAVYRARLLTIGTLAGVDAAAVADRAADGLDATRAGEATTWRFEGTVRLVVRDAATVCALGALPEIDRVSAPPALLDAAASTGAAAVTAAAATSTSTAGG